MKTIQITARVREQLGKKALKQVRAEGDVPGVLYGSKTPLHFAVATASLKDLVYTSEVHFVELLVDGQKRTCILQDLQLHPVSEAIMHIDLLEVEAEKKLKMFIPIRAVGNAPGVAQGGTLSKKLRKLPVLAYAKDMPDHIPADVSTLELGHMLRISDLNAGNYTILSPQSALVISIEIPRALRSAAGKEASEA